MASDTYNAIFTGDWELVYDNDTSSSVNIVVQNGDNTYPFQLSIKPTASPPDTNGSGIILYPLKIFPNISLAVGESLYVKGKYGKLLILVGDDLNIGNPI
jgi:hypothetical protein